jgi:hypothetical protein
MLIGAQIRILTPMEMLTHQVLNFQLNIADVDLRENIRIALEQGHFERILALLGPMRFVQLIDEPVA